MSKEDKIFTAAALAVAIGFTFLDALYFKLMWAWFVVPASGGRLPEINYWLAFGLMLFIHFFFKKSTEASKEKDGLENLCTVIGVAVLDALLFGIAALVKLGVGA